MNFLCPVKTVHILLLIFTSLHFNHIVFLSVKHILLHCISENVVNEFL